MNFHNIEVGIVVNFITAGKMIVAYLIARFIFKYYQKNKKERIWLTYMRIILAVIAVSVFLWAVHGMPIEDEYGYANNMDIPERSQKEKNEIGIINFVTLMIPALYGCYKENKESF
jgi:nitrogen fixation-related uncharacterized protein